MMELMWRGRGHGRGGRLSRMPPPWAAGRLFTVLRDIASPFLVAPRPVPSRGHSWCWPWHDGLKRASDGGPSRVRCSL